MKKVLVVDDDEGILAGFELMLIKAGFAVETSTKDGEIVDEKITSFQPDIIILDVLLSGADGREICRRIKSSPKIKHIPVIMISAHPDAKETALASGANEFLEKPFEINEMLIIIQKHA